MIIFRCWKCKNELDFAEDKIVHGSILVRTCECARCKIKYIGTIDLRRVHVEMTESISFE